MRKLGIVGGTSWSSTALYYEHINRGVAQRLGELHCARLAMVLAVDTRANVIPVYDTTALHARAAVNWMLEDEEQARAAA